MRSGFKVWKVQDEYNRLFWVTLLEHVFDLKRKLTAGDWTPVGRTKSHPPSFNALKPHSSRHFA
jgi:hypothetical protein